MSRSIKTRPFDAAEFLDNDEMIAVFLADAFQSGEARVFQEALQVAARARGMAGIAEASGLGRESLYKALRPDAQPRFETVRRVIEALGVTLNFSPAQAAKAGRSVREPAASYATTAARARGKAGAAGKKAAAKAVRKGGAGTGRAAAKRVVSGKPAAAKTAARKSGARRSTKSATR